MRQEIIRVKNASKSFRGHEVLKKKCDKKLSE